MRKLGFLKRNDEAFVRRLTIEMNKEVALKAFLAFCIVFCQSVSPVVAYSTIRPDDFRIVE